MAGCDTPVDSHKELVDGLETTQFQFSIGRLDREVFGVHPDSIGPSIPTLEARYGNYLGIYFTNITRIGDPHSASFQHQAKLFATDIDMRKLYDDAQRLFGNLDNEQAQLTEAMQRYHAIWPDSIVPQVVADITGLNYAVVVTDSAIGLGLDMFLGADYPMYPAIGLPQYMIAQMVPEQAVPQAIYAWLGSMFETTLPQSTMLDRMVFHGKMLAAIDSLLPTLSDTTKFGFTANQLAWCTTHEAKIWRHLIEQQLLFSNDEMVVTKWVEPAPFVPGLPREGPGRSGRWVGYGLVQAYLEQNPSTTLNQLMLIDPQTLLQGSKYRPTE